MTHVKIVTPKKKTSPIIATNEISISKDEKSVYSQKDLFLPQNRVSYYIYKPARTLQSGAPLHLRVLNSLQLACYKYQLATGLYMLNGTERRLINFLVVASIALTIYHFIL